MASGAVPGSDITLQAPVNLNIPLFTSLTNYAYGADSQAVSTTMGGATVSYDAPLFTPFDYHNSRWWDNLVAEELAARLSVVMMPTRGTYSTDPAVLTGPGDLNPRRLVDYMGALNRAGATSLIKLMCFVDSPAVQSIYNTLYGLPSGTPVDWSSSAGWNDVWWLRMVKPWFDTVPSTSWYRINNRPVIQFWGTHPGWGTNLNGNIRNMIQYVSDQFNATYGVRPYFIMDYNTANAANQDPTVQTQADVIGLNGWFGPPSTANTMKPFGAGGFTSGCIVAGFINPTYFDPTNTNYQNPSMVIPRNKVDGSGANGDTLIDGLEAAYTANADISVMEGWNDVREWALLCRAVPNSRITFPSQCINIVRQYTDLRTVTLRLEVEAADEYVDTTTGNSGGAFRRVGDLDVRTLAGSGWAVTNTAANEWIQFDKVYFSPGNYRFPVRYSATAAGKRVRLLVDGASLGDVTLPATGGVDTFDTISLGQRFVGWGTHNIRVVFIDGGIDLDWVFVRKYDNLISLKWPTNNLYVSAVAGGNSTVEATGAAASNYEKFSANDVNGGSLSANDTLTLQTYDGMLLSAAGGGGAALTADRRRAGSFETFTIVKTNGTIGALADGDSVALRSTNGKYLTIGAGNLANVTGTAIGAAQTFTITLATQ